MKTYIAYLLAGLFLLAAVFLLVAINPAPVFAVTTNQTNATASVTVNAAVDVSLLNVTLAWAGGLDPGTSASANGNNPLVVRIERNTNTKTNISQEGVTNFSDGGSNEFIIGNLSYRNITVTVTTASRNFTEAYTSPCCEFANWKDIAIPTTASINVTTDYFLTIPAGQVAAAYTATVRIKTGVFN